MENAVDLDEMKTLWQQSNRKLEASSRLNLLLLQQWNLRSVDTMLARLARGVTIELIGNVAGIVLLGLFVSHHFTEPRLVIPAGMLYLYAIALVIANARQLAKIAAVDYDEPVVAIQRKLESLRVARIRTTLWTLLFGPLMWLPICIVLVRAMFGVDIDSVASPAWLAANVLFGLAVIPIAIFLARHYGPRLKDSIAMRRIADAIAGRNLAKALDALDSIKRFEEA
jgi:hypothetical protein